MKYNYYTERHDSRTGLADIAEMQMPAYGSVDLQGYQADTTISYTVLPRRESLPWTNRFIKRSFDLLTATVAGVVFAPIIAIIALLIWREDRHSPIFKQRRVGKGGKEFTLYKFRSMRVDAESNGKPQLCCDHDKRLTHIGEFIRNHHLDEFPQLWNVLRGDMSIVGPRPERRYFVDQIMERIPDHALLFSLRPGLFSEATLHNGYTDTIDKMVTRTEMDLEYLNRQSLALDIKIIWQTSMSILIGKKF